MDLSPFWYGAYKVLKYFVYPYTWLTLLSILLLVQLYRPQAAKRLWSIRLLAGALFLIVCFLGNPGVSGLLLGPLESQYPPYQGSARSAGAIVVLAGGLYERGTLRPTDVLTPLSTERTLCGVDLFSRQTADRLVFTGGNAKIVGAGPSEAVEMKRLAIRLGVPGDSIMTETESRTTFENAVATKRLVGNDPIVLVTSASHMPRAMALFRKQGFRATAAPCGYHVKNWPPEASGELPLHLIPTVDALESSTHGISEYVGTWVYRTLGQL